MERHRAVCDKNAFHFRYIEIFKSTLAEARAAAMPRMRGGPMGVMSKRPGPYDRMDRFGSAGGGGGGGGRGGGGRGMSR